MRKFNRFAKGSGVYTCKVCTRRTRETGDGAALGMCEECFDVAGYENQMLDNDPGSEEYESAKAEIERLNKIVVAKGGVL